MKTPFLLIGLLLGATASFAQDHTQVLLAPIEANRIAAFDWGVVTLANPLTDKGGTADRGSLKVNTDLAKFFQEGYAIYSITEIKSTSQATASLMFVLVRPKK